MVAVIVVVSSPQLASVCCDKILVKTDLPRRKGLFQLAGTWKWEQKQDSRRTLLPGLLSLPFLHSPGWALLY